MLMGTKFRDGQHAVQVGLDRVPVAHCIKYLCLRLDPNWTFRKHFRQLLIKVGRTAASIGRIMPNLRGPEELRRRLYANVMMFMILYGAPIWATAVTEDEKLRRSIQSVQRRVGLKVCSGYCTLSHVTVGLLARLLPIDIVARRYKMVYWAIKELQQQGVNS